MADRPRPGEFGQTGTLSGETGEADAVGQSQPAPAVSTGREAPDDRSLDPRIGKVFGKYQITRCIGSGGMATVYAGEDLALKRPVALKFLAERLLEQPAAVERFMREAQVAGRLAHPNIISIYDVCRDRRACYMVMELVNPGSAGQHLRKTGPYYWIVATRILVDCCAALRVAHEAGVIHRDIKPDNILFSSTGVVKLADFGIVKTITDDPSLTVSGQLVGTPVYMSPEQGRDPRDVDFRSDVYSLGATYFALLTARPPFSGSSLLEIMANVRHEDPPDPRDFIAEIPEPCALLIKHALQKSREDRPASAAALLGELQTILDRIPRRQQSIFDLEKELPQPRPRSEPAAAVATPAAPIAAAAESASIPIGDNSVAEIFEPEPAPALPVGPKAIEVSSGQQPAANVPPPPPLKPKAQSQPTAKKDAPQPPRVQPRSPTRRLLLAAGAAGISTVAAWTLLRPRLWPAPSSPLPPTTAPNPTPPSASEPALQPPPPQPVASSAPIRVGVLHSLTGALAISERPLADATLLAIEELNEQGGLLGRKLDPLVLDGKSEVTTESAFARAARRMVVEDKVAVVFGGFGSAGRKAIKPYFEENDCLLFYPASYEGLEESANIVYTGATPNQFVIPAIKWFAKDTKRKRVFLVGTDGVRPRAISTLIAEELAKHKWTLADSEFATVGTYDFAETIKQIGKRKPDLIINLLVGDSLVAFMKQLHQLRRHKDELPVLCFTLGESEMVALSAEALTGHYVARAQFPLVDKDHPSPGFSQRFLKKYGQHRVVSETMEAAYYGVHLWASVVRESGSTSTHLVRNALHSKEYTFEGLRFHVDPSTQHTWKTFELGRIGPKNQVEVLKTDPEPLPPLPFPAGRTRAEWDALLDELREHWQQNWANPSKPQHGRSR